MKREAAAAKTTSLNLSISLDSIAQNAAGPCFGFAVRILAWDLFINIQDDDLKKQIYERKAWRVPRYSAMSGAHYKVHVCRGLSMAQDRSLVDPRGPAYEDLDSFEVLRVGVWRSTPGWTCR